MTTLREALQTIAVLHDGDRPCDCEGHEMARAVALAPSEREAATLDVERLARAAANIEWPWRDDPDYIVGMMDELAAEYDRLDRKETVA